MNTTTQTIPTYRIIMLDRIGLAAHKGEWCEWAQWSTEHPASSYGQGVMVLADGTPVGPAECRVVGQRVEPGVSIEHTAIVRAAGYQWSNGRELTL